MHCKRIPNLNIYFPLFLVTVLTSACAPTMRMYVGEELPKEKIAIIYSENKFRLWGKIVVTHIDDKKYLPDHKAEVLPGIHKVTGQVSRPIRVSSSDLSAFDKLETQYFDLVFNAEAGHKYEVDLKYDLFVIIVDTNSKKVIHKKLIKPQTAQ